MERKDSNVFLNYFYLFCIIIFAGGATVFARSLGDIRTIGNAFALLLTGLVIGQNRIRLNKQFLMTIAVFSLFAVITFIRNRRLSPLWWSQWMIWFTVAYTLCQAFGRTLFAAYEKIIAVLCLISIPFWIAMILSPATTTEFVKLISFSQPFSENCNVFANNIVYTVPPIDFLDNEFNILQRNPGFAWEPGAFASFICLAIFCNILRYDFKIKGNWTLPILIFTLLSTQSTTGYIVAALEVVFWLLMKRKIIPVLILTPCLIFACNLPFVKDKLIEEFAETENLDVANADGGEQGLGRLFSFKLDYDEFLRHPLIGMGGYADGTWLARQGYDLVTISGIGKLLSMFGAIMTLVFLVVLVKSGNKIHELFESKNGYILIVLMIGIMISYNLWTTPLFIAFWMYSLFVPKPRKYKIVAKNV